MSTRREALSKHLDKLKIKIADNLKKSTEVSKNCDLLLEELKKIEEEKSLLPPTKRGRKPKKDKNGAK